MAQSRRMYQIHSGGRRQEREEEEKGESSREEEKEEGRRRKEGIGSWGKAQGDWILAAVWVGGWVGGWMKMEEGIVGYV